MIAQISGKLIYKSPDHLIVDVNGVGYEIHTPLSTFYKLPDTNSPVRLITYTYVREDLLQLYGFLTAGERDLFQLLIGVSGIGPKLAVNILSGIPEIDLCKALSDGDVRKLSSTPGVGKKTAERMVLELRDKIGRITPQDGPLPSATEDHQEIEEDVVSALINLGYKRAAAEKAFKEARNHMSGDLATVEILLKETLKVLSK